MGGMAKILSSVARASTRSPCPACVFGNVEPHRASSSAELGCSNRQSLRLRKEGQRQDEVLGNRSHSGLVNEGASRYQASELSFLRKKIRQVRSRASMTA